MEFLKFAECLHHVRILSKFFGILAELLLCLKVLLEVEVAEFAVDLHHIIELLDIQLICLIDVPVVLCRNRSDSPPSVLDLTELRECRIDIFLLLEKSLEIGNDSLFCSKVVLAFLFELPVVFSTLFLISVI